MLIPIITRNCKGTCEWFDNKLGYGFVRVFIEKDVSSIVFVHKNNILSKNKFLKKNDNLVFHVKLTPKGDKAILVRKLKKQTHTQVSMPLLTNQLQEDRTFMNMNDTVFIVLLCTVVMYSVYNVWF
jgi:cold shock CspA family protein